jgi:putative ABC transport system substrate-binding protein
MAQIRRRDFMTLVGGALAWPLAAHAQAPAKLYRIFWVSTGTRPDPLLEGFREGLRARGYVEGKNVAFELHYAPGNLEALRQVVSNCGAAAWISPWRAVLQRAR